MNQHRLSFVLPNIIKPRQLIILTLTLSFFSCSTKEKREIVKTFSSGKTELEIIYFNPKDILDYSEVTYFENGQIESHKDYHAGKFNGKIIEFYKNGNKKFEGSTDMSSFIGTKYNYDENGNLTQTDSLFTKCGATEC